MGPARTLLFVPGSREGWLEQAPTHGADVVILDLEDAVPPDSKDEARELVGEHIESIAQADQRVYVRPNGHPNSTVEAFTRDVEAVISADLSALLVPEVETQADVEKLDTVLTHLEQREGIEPGSVGLVPTIETTLGVRNVFDICSATDRVNSVVAGMADGGDLNQELGFEWSGPGREALETVHVRQKILLDARAAGVDYPVAATWLDIEDVDGLREDATFYREMGYSGYAVIHPSHVDPVNDVFTPDSEEIEHWVGVREALVEAKREGKSAVRYEGQMIDTAHLGTAERFLRRAQLIDDETLEDMDIDVDVLEDV